jgi:hypothetical protein
LGFATAPAAQAQEVSYDSVVLGEGNANMSFYSLANGELAQVSLAGDSGMHGCLGCEL